MRHIWKFSIYLSFVLGLSLGLSMAHPVAALELDLPANARQMTQSDSVLDSFSAPTGPFQNGALPSILIEGEIRRSVWRIASSGVTTLQILAPLRSQLESGGYTITLDCDQFTCGGFDFRFGIEVLPSPDMHVNIRSFRYVTAVKGAADAPSEVIGLLVSTSESAAFVQIIQAGKLDEITNTIAPTEVTAVEPQVQEEAEQRPIKLDATSFEQTLLSKGTVVLSGLEFAIGTSDLGEGPFTVLDELAAFFKNRSDIKLVLVGHTDSVGALDFNIALSKQRAASVRQRLLDDYDLDANRISAEGNGYLSPLRSNLEADGRTANRRVEAVVLPLP